MYKRLLTLVGLWETPLEAQPEDRRKSLIKWRCEHTCVVHRRFMGDRRFVTWLCVNIFPRFVCSTSGIISTFLHVHPFGASIEYICSYLQRLDTKVTDSHESKLLLLWIRCTCTGSVYPFLYRTDVWACMPRPCCAIKTSCIAFRAL